MSWPRGYTNLSKSSIGLRATPSPRALRRLHQPRHPTATSNLLLRAASFAFRQVATRKRARLPRRVKRGSFIFYRVLGTYPKVKEEKAEHRIGTLFWRTMEEDSSEQRERVGLTTDLFVSKPTWQVLTVLNCFNSRLTELPPLPATLEKLLCESNLLKSLPSLPPKLILLNASTNMLTRLPSLPESLLVLNIKYNRLVSLPPLPSVLEELYCDQNRLTSLPGLTNETLTRLTASHNSLRVLPFLPRTLILLSVHHNNLKVLPNMGHITSSFQVFCQCNSLVRLPRLASKGWIAYHNTPIYKAHFEGTQDPLIRSFLKTSQVLDIEFVKRRQSIHHIAMWRKGRAALLTIFVSTRLRWKVCLFL